MALRIGAHVTVSFGVSSIFFLVGCGANTPTADNRSSTLEIPEPPIADPAEGPQSQEQKSAAPGSANGAPALVPPGEPAEPLLLVSEGCGECPAGEFCSSTNQCMPTGSCAADADCPEEGSVCEAGVCQAGGECGTEVFEIETVPPNIMLLLDRSCSMPDCAKYNVTRNCFNNSGVDKWGDAVTVINELTENFRGDIRWGLDLFPDTTGDKCGQDDPVVALQSGQEDVIQSLLTGALNPSDPLFPTGPCVTNILGVLDAASRNPDLRDPERDTFTILITDGEEVGCGDRESNHQDAVTAVQNLAKDGIQTFVIGFGGGVEPAQLNELAVAGERSNPEPATDFYQAANATVLAATLAELVKATVGCTVSLNEVPPEPDKLFAFLGQQQLERGTADGYEYNAMLNQVEFLGAACEAVKQGEQMVQVGFGCPENRPQITR